MTVCWKYLVPISFVNLGGTAVTMVIEHAVPGISWPLRLTVLGAATVGVIAFFARVRFQLRRARPEFYYSPVI
jgi:hypothetical protein